MSSEQDNFITSLCGWIGSLELPSGTPSVELLFTGRPIAEALHSIDNDFFDAQFLDGIPSRGVESNWRIKASSMRKIHEKLVDYFNEVSLSHFKTNFLEHSIVRGYLSEAAEF